MFYYTEFVLAGIKDLIFTNKKVIIIYFLVSFNVIVWHELSIITFYQSDLNLLSLTILKIFIDCVDSFNIFFFFF